MSLRLKTRAYLSYSAPLLLIQCSSGASFSVMFLFDVCVRVYVYVCLCLFFYCGWVGGSCWTMPGATAVFLFFFSLCFLIVDACHWVGIIVTWLWQFAGATITFQMETQPVWNSPAIGNSSRSSSSSTASNPTGYTMTTAAREKRGRDEAN